jgi:hypothetical protein
MSEPCYAPVFEPRTWLDCLLRAIGIISALPALILFSWLPSVHCLLLRLLFELRRCGTGNRETGLDLAFDPNDWLTRMQLSSEVIWEEPQGTLRPHNTWTRDERNELTQLYWKARFDEPIGFSEAPPEAAPAATGRASGTAYPRNLAWRIFIGHIAQSIAVESARRVPWTLMALTPLERAVFFDSRSFFRPSGSLYSPQVTTDGYLTHGDPVLTFRFLRGLGVLGPDSRTVIDTMLEWTHANMIHFLNNLDPANCVNHWGYSGYPPVAAVISGTRRTSDGEFSHWSAGCWGLTAFVRAVLRTANIGVALNVGGRHAQPHFLRDDVFLSHGDDPYTQTTYTTPPYPMSLLPISRAQHTAWYGPGVPAATAEANVSRRTAELAIDHPESLYLMRVRCRDIAAGTAHAGSNVYAEFSAYYSVAELEARTLWERIDAAIAARGGCGSF